MSAILSHYYITLLKVTEYEILANKYHVGIMQCHAGIMLKVTAYRLPANKYHARNYYAGNFSFAEKTALNIFRLRIIPRVNFRCLEIELTITL